MTTNTPPHYVKHQRWEVVSTPTSDGLKGTWLPSDEAKEMLLSGDFYSVGTCLQLMPEDKVVWVIKCQNTHRPISAKLLVNP